MAELTVVTFKWDGWRLGYTAEHVNRLYRAVSAHLSVPHRFVCITDDPAGIECETFAIWTDPEVPSRPMRQDCFRRLKLFSSWAAEQWPGWILHLDLDALVLGSLDPLITWEDFRILKGLSSTPYNGSLWLLRTGTRTRVWDLFDPATSPWDIREHRTGSKPYRGSDQAWISIMVPGGPTYSREWGVYQCGKRGLPQQPRDARIVFFPGDLKPWHPEIAEKAPWAHKLYLTA